MVKFSRRKRDGKEAVNHSEKPCTLVDVGTVGGAGLMKTAVNASLRPMLNKGDEEGG